MRAVLLFLYLTAMEQSREEAPGRSGSGQLTAGSDEEGDG